MRRRILQFKNKSQALLYLKKEIHFGGRLTVMAVMIRSSLPFRRKIPVNILEIEIKAEQCFE